MKLAMMRRIAHHTSGEAKPLTPVQDHALSVFATSVAPRFNRNSDTSTHATLRASCSQGLPKPEGRFCICFFLLFVMSSEVACQAVASCEGPETSPCCPQSNAGSENERLEIPPLRSE